MIPSSPLHAHRRRPRPGTGILHVLAAAAALSGTALPATGQSPLRTPNLPGPWVGPPGILHLDALHRFHRAAPGDDALGLTTLSAAWGIGGYALAGVTRVGGEEPGEGSVDEWEIALRFSPFTSAVGAPADLGVTAAYNEEFGSFDGELVVGLPLAERRFHLLGTLRLLGDAFGAEDSRWILGGGALLRLHENVSLSADLLTAADPLEGEEVAWGASARLLVPGTPATVAVEATNTRTTTLHASALRGGGTRWGVRLHVPVPLGRILGGQPGEVDTGRAGQEDLVAGDTVAITMGEEGFEPAEVTVRPGTWVRWTHAGSAIHSVVAADGSWESPLLAPGESFGRVFTEPGTYAYGCRLHPGETGTVTVTGGGPAGP